jgi:hypothetical protein
MARAASTDPDGLTARRAFALPGLAITNEILPGMRSTRTRHRCGSNKRAARAFALLSVHRLRSASSGSSARPATRAASNSSPPTALSGSRATRGRSGCARSRLIPEAHRDVPAKRELPPRSDRPGRRRQRRGSTTPLPSRARRRAHGASRCSHRGGSGPIVLGSREQVGASIDTKRLPKTA